MTAKRFLGLISGTSADGIDAALVDIGSENSLKTVDFETFAYPGELRRALIDAAHEADHASYTGVALLDQQVGLAFADAARDMLARSDVPVVAIGSHGQTLFHSPDSSPAFTIQIGDPNQIACATGLPVVGDLRRMDMAAGGQGAPLASALHARVLGSSSESRAVLNLGGIANLTLLPAGGDTSVLGFDTGPASCLMDYWVAKVRKIAVDENGHWAASGEVDGSLLERMLAEPYFSRPPPKSTGREYFSAAWLDAFVSDFCGGPEDLQATLCELTARTVADALLRHQPDCARLAVCGGGVHNGELMRRLKAHLDIEVESTAIHGVNPDATEATLMAWLAWARIEGKAGNMPSVTGANRPVILGAIYDGRHL